jgi:decaprenyl-phosphate phosphoribosyltransferase
MAFFFKETVKRARLDEGDAPAFDGCAVVLDVDGTLLPDGEQMVGAAVAARVAEIAARNVIYLASNKRDAARLKALAARLGVRHLPRRHRKPSVRVLDEMAAEDRARPLVVVGDRWLTDGLLAARVGGRFFRVQPHGLERSALQAAVWRLDAFAHWLVFALRQLRPGQWVKNLLVLAPLFFAGELWGPKTGLALLAFASFSLAASGVYALNDVLDRPLDRLHSVKRFRPVASGGLAAWQAVALALACLVGAVALADLALSRQVAVLIAGYVALNGLYSLWLKHVVPLDIVLVAGFFALRVLVGGVAADVHLSPWIFLAVFSLALLIVVGKRFSESAAANARPSLRGYSRELLTLLLGVSLALTVVSYGLYSVLGQANPLFISSGVLVAAALFRYVCVLFAGRSLEMPEQALFVDPVIVCCSVAWLAQMVAFFYF